MSPRISHSLEWLFCVLVCCSLLALGACSGGRPALVELRGAALGTFWQVSYLEPKEGPSEEHVFAAIDGALRGVDESMSTYREDSEISMLNRAPVGDPVPVSAAFAEVLTTALRVGEQSRGAYDVTVMPLVSLWGFGPGERVDQPPTQASIEASLAQVGQDKLALAEVSRTVIKLGAVTLDFSSLAKGYAVDQIARALIDLSIDNFLVEVGGEMKLSGLSHRGDPWRVAIEQPAVATRTIATSVSLTDKAIATSGDYRNYFEFEGQRYSHTLDPRSGYPVQHGLVSVTVVHDSAMLADAWATALLVLGSERATQTAQELGLAAYFIRREEGTFEESYSLNFAPLLQSSGP